MSTSWYLKGKQSACEGALQLLDDVTALGKNSQFPCPLRVPERVLNNLEVICVPYFSFDGEVHQGQLVVHREISEKLRAIFSVLSERRFPIASMVPIVNFGWDDEKSMRANNTSAWNYRYVYGTKRFSSHALGLAIDINPRLNPCVLHGHMQPTNGSYNTKVPGTITKNSLIVKLFKQHGALWGGDWEEPFDPQHFEFQLK